MMPTMDYSKLKGRIKECGFTQKSLAEEIGTSEGQFCLENIPLSRRRLIGFVTR